MVVAASAVKTASNNVAHSAWNSCELNKVCRLDLANVSLLIVFLPAVKEVEDKKVLFRMLLV